MPWWIDLKNVPDGVFYNFEDKRYNVPLPGNL